MSATRQFNGAAIVAVAFYLVCWGGAVGYLYSKGGEDWMEAVIVAGVFGVAIPLIGWLLNLGAKSAPIEVRRPVLESGAVFGYLAFYVAGFLLYGLNWAHAVLPPGREQDLLILGMKLVVHVVLPVLLLAALGARIAPLFQAGMKNTKFWRTLIGLSIVLLVVQSFISPSLKHIAETGATVSTLLWAAPAAFVLVTIEAGLCEEVLFRAVVQTRLTALFKSPWFGVVVTSLIFALVHAPGLYLRGSADTLGTAADPFQVAAYVVAIVSPIALMFGMIYQRTKSLLLVVLLHGVVDVLPNLDDFIKTWT